MECGKKWIKSQQHKHTHQSKAAHASRRKTKFASLHLVKMNSSTLVIPHHAFGTATRKKYINELIRLSIDFTAFVIYAFMLAADIVIAEANICHVEERENIRKWCVGSPFPLYFVSLFSSFACSRLHLFVSETDWVCCALLTYTAHTLFSYSLFYVERETQKECNACSFSSENLTHSPLCFMLEK